jgi:hypothetical protein
LTCFSDACRSTKALKIFFLSFSRLHLLSMLN